METAFFIILALLLPVSFMIGRRIGAKAISSAALKKRIEEYPFYPFITNDHGIVEFSQALFNEGVQHLTQHKNSLAAQQLIIIGEQNNVRNHLSTEELNRYQQLYQKYEGQKLLQENDQFMENYKRIVTLIGKSFKGTGIEILLHNLVNPTKSIIAIENGEVTGRKIENGTTNLLLDLKTRKIHNQDKLNYELEIGARKFKCTTIPIFRNEYGLVGAICINVDENFIRHEVMGRRDKLEAFIDKLLKTDFQLKENILSREEYQAAITGKRHYADDILFSSTPEQRSNKLVALFLSDIVEYSAHMGRNEKQTMRILEDNRKIHQEAMSQFHGTMLKEMGDGILASFQSVSDAVHCAMQIQEKTNQSNEYNLRIGIHLGEVNIANNDIFGDGVNIVSRIQALAEPGTIYMSEVVYNNVRNKISGEATFVGERELKNIEEPVKMYKLL